MAIENNFGDAAIMGGVHTDSHDDNSVTNNYVNNTTNNSSVVNNSTVYAAQRTSIEISQDNEREFLKAVQERFADGYLDKAELAELYQLAIQWQVSESRAGQIIDVVRSSTSAIKGDNGNDYLAIQLIQEIFNAVQCNDVNVLKRKMQPLKDVARYSQNSDVLYYHNMLMASLSPEVATVSQLNSRADDYWQTYWSCVAYTKLGNMDNASSLLYKLGNFGAPNGDVALLLAINNIADYRRCDGQEYYKKQATQYLDQAVQEGMSDQLSPLWYAAQSIIQDQTDYAEEWYKFYIDTTLKEFVCPKVVHAEKTANIQAPPPSMPAFDPQKATLQQMQGFNALQAAQNMGLGQMPSMGGMPQMPSMGGMPQMPSMGGMPQMPSMGGTPQMPSMGGMPQMPSMGGTPQMPSTQKCEERAFTQESVQMASEVRHAENEDDVYDDYKECYGIILTNSIALANKYGCDVSRVLEVFGNFINYASQQKMYWSFMDVAEFYDNGSWEDINDAISRFIRQNNLQPSANLHLFIVGGDDVIPIPWVNNPYENQRNTPIPSDTCYCFEGRYVLDIIEGENLPFTISAARNNVSRLPLENGTMSTTIEEDLMSYFNKSSLYGQGIPVGNVVMSSCADWIPASTTMSEHLPLTFNVDDPELIKNGMYISPKLLTDDSEAIRIYSQSLMKADMLMFNLHGADYPDYSGFYSSSEAFNIPLLKCSNARVFNTVACFGARFMDYDRNQSMLLQAMYESGVLLYTGSLIPVPMFYDREMNEARELLLNPGTGSEVFMRLYPLYQFKGMTAGRALLQAKCDYFNMCRYIESDGFSFATALMFSLYGNPMLHVCKRNHVVESALQNDAMPPAPVKSMDVPLRKTLTYEIANMADSRSLLEQLRAGVDANISAMHEITSEYLYKQLGLEPRHMYSIEQYSRPKEDGEYEVGYMYNYHNPEAYISPDVHVAVDGEGKIKRLYTNK